MYSIVNKPEQCIECEDNHNKEADEARRPLIAPSTPITQTSSSTILSPIIDQYELLSDETLDEIISDSPLTLSPNETIIPGRISFASQYPYMIGRQSIIYDRQNDILTIIIDCNEKTIEIKNERTLNTYIIYINSNYCPLPWLFAVNFNYKNKDSMHLLH